MTHESSKKLYELRVPKIDSQSESFVAGWKSAWIQDQTIAARLSPRADSFPMDGNVTIIKRKASEQS